MVCGVVGLGLVCTIDTISVLGLVPSLLAIPLAIVALQRISKGVSSGRGLAWTGLVAGIIGSIIYLIALVYLVAVLVSGDGSASF